MYKRQRQGTGGVGHVARAARRHDLGLGRRLSRAAGAHTLLACAAAYCVRDAEVRGRSDASTFVKLRKGLRAVGVLHLLCFAAKVAFDDWSQYPAASTKPILSVASLATYAAAAAI